MAKISGGTIFEFLHCKKLWTKPYWEANVSVKGPKYLDPIFINIVIRQVLDQSTDCYDNWTNF